jgi:folate-binding protein YgfZ
MLTSWQDFLTHNGAVLDNGKVAHFDDQEQELLAASNDTVLADLSHLGLIKATGEDTQTFLQGQFTNDVRKLSPTLAQLSGWCSPKGRLLATFLLWQTGGNYYVQLPLELQPAIQKRLTMFVMRSKVILSDVSKDMPRFGVAGKNAESILATQLGALPQVDFGVANADGILVIRLPGARFEIIASVEKSQALWSTLAKNTKPVGSDAWQWLEVRAAVPIITQATQEQFVPQMVNLEAIGGVSFQKGCYPGQEIVARTQYLGKLKRRMYLAHLDNALPPQAGDELYSPEMDGQACGMLVNAQAAPAGGYDVLAVMQIGSAEANDIHLKALDGPKLALEALPYPLD